MHAPLLFHSAARLAGPRLALWVLCLGWPQVLRAQQDAQAPKPAHTPWAHLVEVDVQRQDKSRKIRLRLDCEPQYHVLRRNDPQQLIVDIAGGDVTALGSALPLGDRLLGNIALSQYTGEHRPVGRVTIPLAQDVRYHVTSEGRDIIIATEPSDAQGVADATAATQAADVPDAIAAAPAQTAPAPSAGAQAVASAAPVPVLEGEPPRVAVAEPAAAPAPTPAPTPVQKAEAAPVPSTQRAGVIVKMQRQLSAVHVRTRGKPKISTLHLSEPSRLVVDVDDARALPRALRLGSRPSWLKKVRVGTRPTGFRLVFDLASGHDARIEQGPRGIWVRARPGTTTAMQRQSSAGAKASEQIAQRGERVAGFAADAPPATPPIPDEVPSQAPDQIEPSTISPSGNAKATFPLQDPSAHMPADPGTATAPSGDDDTQAPTMTPVQQTLRRALGRGLQPLADTQPPTPLAPADAGRGVRGGPGTGLVGVMDAGELTKLQAQNSRLHRRRISLDVKDADIINVLRLISEETGENIIASDEVKGKVTLKLRNVPADQALDTMLRTKGFDRVRHNNIVRIASAEAIQKERDLELARRRSLVEVEDAVIKMVTINYATASEVITQLKSMLSPRGSVQVDARTNTLIIQDIISNIDRVVELAQRLDKQTPLVNIQARIVEASSNHVRDLGVQWGGSSQNSVRTGNATGLYFPHDVLVSGAADAGSTNQAGGIGAPSRYAVNLPATLGGGGGGLGFILGSAGGSQLLDLRLTAMETNGNGKIISSPEVATLDNRMARIAQGTEIPISTVSAAGTMTRFVAAMLALEVTPHVTNDGTVLLKINVQKSQPDFTNRGGAGDPTIQKKQAETEVLVRDGDTSVIGGIYTRDTSDSFNEVPFLARIPLIGRLFQEKRVQDNRSELLVFITPRIINRDESLVQSGQTLEGTKN